MSTLNELGDAPVCSEASVSTGTLNHAAAADPNRITVCSEIAVSTENSMHAADVVCDMAFAIAYDSLLNRSDPAGSVGTAMVVFSPNAAEVSCSTAFAVGNELLLSDLRGPGCSMDVLGVTCLYSAAAVCCEGAELSER